MTEPYAVEKSAILRAFRDAERIRADYEARFAEEGQGAPNPDVRLGEREMLGCISLGNPSLVEDYVNGLPDGGASFPVGQLSASAARQARYVLICSITMFSRCAIDSGLTERMALGMSDAYIRAADAMDDPQQIRALFFAALYDYARAVRDYRLQNCSPALRRCCEYIMAHLCGRIALKDLGQACWLSPHYVSDLFRKELGQSPTEYIRASKLSYAHLLLSGGNRSVSEVASMLAFPSHSSFSAQFRQAYGMTPHEFRRRRGAGQGPD